MGVSHTISASRTSTCKETCLDNSYPYNMVCPIQWWLNSNSRFYHNASKVTSWILVFCDVHYPENYITWQYFRVRKNRLSSCLGQVKIEDKKNLQLLVPGTSDIKSLVMIQNLVNIFVDKCKDGRTSDFFRALYLTNLIDEWF